MTTNKRTSSTAAFDEMLARNRRELDALYPGPASTAGAPSFTDPPPPPPATEPPATSPPSARRAPEPDSADSETVRTLNERYGDGWRYDVIDRRREGDEIIVLCKLVIDEGEVTKAQFGSARVGGGGTPTAGSAGGMSFSFGTSRSASVPSSPASPEELAYARAVDAALARCAAMLGPP